MTRIRRRSWLVVSAIALTAGCAGKNGEFARDMGMAAGEGALSGFSNYVTYRQENQWGQAWTPSGRGVEGVASRAAREQDCSAVEDESLLYVGDLLRSPGSFVSTIDGEIDNASWKTLHAAGLRLTGPRKGGAIGILRTTAGRYARFVLQWGDQPQLHDLTVYNEATGEVVLRFEVPMPLAPHALVNLDKGESEGFDLLFGPDPDGRPTLAAGEGAALSFPIASLCKPPKHARLTE
jgi:hypothetical protein